MTPRRLTDEHAADLIERARRTATDRTTQSIVATSVGAEIIERSLATHLTIAPVLADDVPEPKRSQLLHPLRVVLRRESAWLLSPMCEQLGADRAARLVRDIDDVVSPMSIDCLIAASPHDESVVKQVLADAMTTIFVREGAVTSTSSTPVDPH